MIVSFNCGHTLTGPGYGAVGEVPETTWTRSFGYAIMSELTARGHVVYNCTVDKAGTAAEYLAESVKMANDTRANLFVSLHFNAAGSTARGVECYTWGGKPLPKAAAVCDGLEKLGFINRGIKNGSGLYVIKNTRATAILIELCFITSPADVGLVKQVGKEKIVKAICDALEK